MYEISKLDVADGRIPASERLDILLSSRLHLPLRRTLAQICIPKSNFYTWQDRYLSGGLDALEDHDRTNGATPAECDEPDRGPAADCQIRSHEFAKIIIMSNISKARTIGLHAIN